jgi:hypothetical protein
MSDSSRPVAESGDLGWRLWLAGAGLVVAVVAGLLLEGPLSEPLLRSGVPPLGWTGVD